MIFCMAAQVTVTPVLSRIEPERCAGIVAVNVLKIETVLDGKLEVDQTLLAAVKRRMGVMTGNAGRIFPGHMQIMSSIEGIPLPNNFIFYVALPAKLVIGRVVKIVIADNVFFRHKRVIESAVGVMAVAAAVVA